jgi:substrate binding protein of glycine betaine ABC transport system
LPGPCSTQAGLCQSAAAGRLHNGDQFYARAGQALPERRSGRLAEAGGDEAAAVIAAHCDHFLAVAEAAAPHLGLERTHGLRFKAFTATDTGGPLTLQALEAGQIGVGLLFTTDPSIPARHLVILADSRALQPTENVTPLLRRATVDRSGPRLLATLKCCLSPPVHGRAAFPRRAGHAGRAGPPQGR